MNPSALGPGGEFDRIRALLGEPRTDTAGRGGSRLSVGPGDDAAVLGEWVISTDLTVEDVHFRREWIDLGAVGYRAVVVALSDLGAMGAEPEAVFLSLALPDAGPEAVRELGAGARAAADWAGAELAGGDLSRSPGPLVLDVVAVGKTRDPVLRSGARPGDDLWVSGCLGGAAAAVEAWERGETPSPPMLRRFEAPHPPLGLLASLRRTGRVTSGIDVSDGLLSDAGHLAAASGVAIHIHDARVPVDPALEHLDPSRRLTLALAGGEDYEILFTAPVAARGALEPVRLERGGAEGARVHTDEGEPVRLTRIGEVTEGEGVWRKGRDGVSHRIRGGGFDHFPSDVP
ncbi:MAG: thiamine-phosphate kinase [Gemmatimonadota bacterium]